MFSSVSPVRFPPTPPTVHYGSERSPELPCIVHLILLTPLPNLGRPADGGLRGGLTKLVAVLFRMLWMKGVKAVSHLLPVAS
jgi:hypothetical protein